MRIVDQRYVCRRGQKGLKDYIPSLVGVEAKVIIEAKNEKEAIKFFKEFVKQLKEREVEIQDE